MRVRRYSEPYHPPVITPGQIRAARALIGWQQKDLAVQAGISEMTIKNIEQGRTDPRSSSLTAIQKALDEGGWCSCSRATCAAAALGSGLKAPTEASKIIGWTSLPDRQMISVQDFVPVAKLI